MFSRNIAGEGEENRREMDPKAPPFLQAFRLIIQLVAVITGNKSNKDGRLPQSTSHILIWHCSNLPLVPSMDYKE